MPLLPSALPPKGEARRYVANDFLNLIALPKREACPPAGSPAASLLYAQKNATLIDFMISFTPGDPPYTLYLYYLYMSHYISLSVL